MFGSIYGPFSVSLSCLPKRQYQLGIIDHNQFIQQAALSLYLLNEQVSERKVPNLEKQVIV